MRRELGPLGVWVLWVAAIFLFAAPPLIPPPPFVCRRLIGLGKRGGMTATGARARSWTR
jgi:hypothetical protein